MAHTKRTNSSTIWVLWTLLFGCSSLWSGCSLWRVLYPATIYESISPELPPTLRKPSVLLYSKTNGYRHHDAIPAANALFQTLAEERNIMVYATENGAVFTPEILQRFDVVVWNNTSGDTLDSAQKEAWMSWLKQGGAAIAIHAAGGDFSYKWEWYPTHFIRAQHTRHTMGPQFQTATLMVESNDHPVTRQLPASWQHKEEWYSFAKSPRDQDVTVLISVDEQSYDPRFSLLWMNEDISMGDHPIVWCHCIERGRVLYSALGHRAEAYQSPEMKLLLGGALDWARDQSLSDCREAP